jgi:dynein heavy chain
MQTQIKRMNRRVREWGVYKDMEERVANMATVLPLVNHLHSPAMRDRHWRSLVQVTKKSFEKTPAFALQVRPDTPLHLYASFSLTMVFCFGNLGTSSAVLFVVCVWW